MDRRVWLRTVDGIQAIQVRSRKTTSGIISPLSLRDVYAAMGEYSAKMIIDPRQAQAIDRVHVEVRNSDGEKMDFAAKRWGTKLTVDFRIDASTPDGVSIIDVTMYRKGEMIRERFDFWVIK